MTQPATLHYQALLLDLDGTIVDSRKGIQNCLRRAMDRLGIQHDGMDLLPYIGPPIQEIFWDITGDEALTQLGIRYYRQAYAQSGVHENELLPGIEEAIRELRNMGYRLMLATSKPQKYAKIILEDFHLEDQFELIGGATLDGKISKKIEVIQWVLQTAGLSPKDALMIGDRKFDLIGAQQAGMDAMGILFGFGSRQELREYPHVYLAPTARDMVEYLRR